MTNSGSFYALLIIITRRIGVLPSRCHLPPLAIHHQSKQDTSESEFDVRDSPICYSQLSHKFIQLDTLCRSKQYCSCKAKFILLQDKKKKHQRQMEITCKTKTKSGKTKRKKWRDKNDFVSPQMENCLVAKEKSIKGK